MDKTLNGLIYSRKFWLLIVGVIQSIALNVLNVDPEVWVSINALLAVLIGAIAHEDAGKKSGNHNQGPVVVNDPFLNSGAGVDISKEYEKLYKVRD